MWNIQDLMISQIGEMSEWDESNNIQESGLPNRDDAVVFLCSREY